MNTPLHYSLGDARIAAECLGRIAERFPEDATASALASDARAQLARLAAAYAAECIDAAPRTVEVRSTPNRALLARIVNRS